MSRNIYDVFNERKNGIDALIEGTYADEYEEFDSIEEAAYAMEEIIQENMNACIEFQAASYLEDLVLENMIYDSFDEELIQDTLTESFAERKDAIIERLQNAWETVKGWFRSVKAAIAKALHLSAEWAQDNASAIVDAVENCQIKVKYPGYYDFRTGINKFKKLVNMLHEIGKKPVGEGAILAKLGIKDRSQVPQVVKKCFMKLDEPQVMQINKISGDIVVDWAACKDDFMDEVEYLEDATNKRFSTIIAALNKHGNDNERTATLYKNFTYINGIINTMTSNLVSVVKKACSDNSAIARKAMGKVGNAVANTKERVKGMVARESYEYDDDYEVLEEGLLNKFRKLGVEELEEKIAQLQAAVEDIEAGNGPKKFLKKAKAELKEAKKALASKEKKAGKAEAKAEKKAAKAEAKAAKKAAKQGGVMPAAESFMLDFDEIEFVDDEYDY